MEACICHEIPAICFQIEPLFDFVVGKFEMRNSLGLERWHNDLEDFEGEVHGWIYSCTTQDAQEPHRLHDIPDTISRVYLIQATRVGDLIHK